MSGLATIANDFVLWGTAARLAAAGEPSGDAFRVRVGPDGTLVAVVDADGSGEAAHAAAREALHALSTAASLSSLANVLVRCHERCIHTTGVAMTALWFDAGRRTLTWGGVGSVAGVLRASRGEDLRTGETPPLGSGVLGRHLPRIATATLELRPGDRVVVATPGLDRQFAVDPDDDPDPRALAERLLARHRIDGEEALVWVGRIPGSRS